MERKIVSGIMLTLLLIGVLTLAFNIQPVTTELSERKVGVNVGYWIQYRISVTWESNDPNATTPQHVLDSQQLLFFSNVVQSVSGTNITFDRIMHFQNGTEKSYTYWVDVDTGRGSTYLFFISANLSAGDIIYTGIGEDIGEIDETITRSYLGETVEVNHSNSTTSNGYFIYGDIYWNKATGVLYELYMNHTTYTTKGEETYATQETQWLYPVGIVDVARTWIVNDDGPADFHTIQEAINAASDKDTIFVHSGTYYEHVVVNKTVSLVGENRNTTVIDGNGTFWKVMKVTADNASVMGFTVKNSSGFGIWIWNSSGNIILDNYVTDTFYGIRLDHSTNNVLKKNIVKDNCFMGILLSSSSNNILRYNKMTDNPENFGVWATSLPNFINDVDNSNKVDGKAIYYWVNRGDSQIPMDAGFVAVVNSSNIVVKNLILANNDHGIYFAYTNNSYIENNTIISNTYGIDMFQSFNNTISSNVVLQNTIGISMRFISNNNIVRDNSVIASSNGVYLYKSNGNRIIGNTIRNSRNYGIDFKESNSNSFHHNNLISNNKNVSPYTTGANLWDDGYPSGGNYWSDYTGVDLYNGPFQNETGSDGIGDDPYVIDESNQDNYPLMEPWSHVEVVDANIDIDPDTLNLRSKGKWITAFIGLPVGYDVADINRTSILLNDTIPDDSFWVDKPLQSVIGDYDEDGIPDLMVKFDRAKVIKLISDAISSSNNKFMEVALTLTGQFFDGTYFQGNDTIRIVSPYEQKSHKYTFTPI